MNNSWWSFRRRPLKIFISYRREDSVDSTGRLYKDLKLHFSRPFRNYLSRRVVVVRDFDSIPAGINFQEYINKEIKASAAFLTVIGKDWLKVVNPQTGQRRIEELEDPVRIEITTALSLSIPVIPVLVENAPMPGKQVLPDALKALASMNAREVNEPGWDADVERLIADLEKISYSPWAKFSGIALLALLLAAFSALTVFVYGKCCTGGFPPPAPSPSPTATPSVVVGPYAASSPSPSPSSSPSPSLSPTPSPPPASTPTATHPLKNADWIYEKLNSRGKPIIGYVINFDSTESYIFRCYVDEDASYTTKCLNQEPIESKHPGYERKWYLDGNKVTIYWNKGDPRAQEVDEGVVSKDGKRMAGTTFIKGIEAGKWVARRMN